MDASPFACSLHTQRSLVNRNEKTSKSKCPMESRVVSTTNSFAATICGSKWATVSIYDPMDQCVLELEGGKDLPIEPKFFMHCDFDKNVIKLLACE